MLPVTIKSEQLIDGLLFSQFVLIVVIISSWFLMPWPWLLLSLPFILVMFLNHRKIVKNQTGCLQLNSEGHWFWFVGNQLEPCSVGDFWHTGGTLWLRLESEQGRHHCLINKNRIGGRSYAQLLLAVNQNEQQTE